MPEPTDETFGRYTLHRRFAVGGMAELFLAQQRASAGVWRLVVVKRLLPQYADDDYYCTMFLDEARIASRLSHPNIVQVIDFGEQDGRQFMAMEYVPGETLREVLRLSGEHGITIPLDVALQVIMAACDGLHYAHEYAENGTPLGLVHRDISPTNLMITYQGQVKVLDFGIAKAADRVQDKTATGITKGKISYMPPEQYRAEPLDRRADVWALATVAYEAITGVHPFRRATEEATMKAILLDDLAPPSAFRLGLPPRLDQALLRAMSVDVHRRHATARELREDLEAAMPGPPAHLDEFMLHLFGSARARQRI